MGWEGGCTRASLPLEEILKCPQSAWHGRLHPGSTAIIQMGVV